MSIRRIASVVIGLLMLFTVVGCSDTAIGGLLGAGGGAMVGSAVGHPLAGALIGGVGGAVVGHEVGKSSRPEPPPRVAYGPDQYGPRPYEYGPGGYY
jgi:osmotically inducible lipoprotein OsmB